MRPTEPMTLAHDSFGAPGDPALLLISGLGTQMTRWPDNFCRRLAQRWFRVIRADNRDAGLSPHLDHLPPPDFARLRQQLEAGEKPEVPYTLCDMAADVIALMDRLEIPQAHIVGRSMGGMIAQILASEWPDRVLSLVSIMSATGNPAMPQARPEIMALLQTPPPDPRRDLDGFLANRVAFARAIAGSVEPLDDAAERERLLLDLHRSHDPAGSARQLAAMATAGDRRARLATIRAPSLVIHGTEDPLFPPECGQDTAAAIPDARLVLLRGMGHDIPTGLQDRIIDDIARTAQQQA